MGKSRKKRKKTTFGDERIRLISGLVLVFFSLLALLAFISFLFTWKEDQSLIGLSVGEILDQQSQQINNWAGKAGLVISALFIHQWFGIASIGFLFITFLAGMHLWKIRPLPFLQTTKNTLILIILMSVYLGYFFGDNYFVLGGGHGYFVSRWLNTLLGKAGTILFLLVLTFVFVVYRFRQLYLQIKTKVENIRFRKSSHGKSSVEDEQNEENIDKRTFEPVQEDIPENDSSEYEEENEGSADIERAGEEEKPNGIDFEIEDTSHTEDSIEEQDEPEYEQPGLNQKETTSQEENAFDNNLIEINVKYPEPETADAQNDNDDRPRESSSDEEIGLEVEQGKKEEEASGTKPLERLGEYDPRLDLEHYEFPSFDLLPRMEQGGQSQRVSHEELEANKMKIVETLGNYNIKIDKIKATIGPTVTLYEIIPAPGIRISKIKNLEDDIALSLAALGIRIIAPMPGKGTVGIEVPNQNPEIVSMRSVIASKKFQESKMQLPIALGKTITNETFIIDLAKMPHLLVAGATGQGKSVGLNVILTSLLYKKHPAELKLVLVDPKKVELSLYNQLHKHFLTQVPGAEEPIITDTQKVIDTLNSLTIEMDDRYELLKQAHARSLKEYNKKFIERRLNPENGHRYLPYIVVAVDEYADLIMTAGKEIEMPIARLAQKARAIGIHLIIATQRPTTNIITGVIKANFPARIAFRVISGVDSKTILDGPGANQLIGRGDMLISTGAEPIRLQCAFVDTPELEDIMAFIEKQQSYGQTHELPESQSEGGSPGMADLEKRDAMFEDAARLIVVHQQGSTSLIQRKFSIGYNRAGRIVDQLEAAGIVGPPEGSKARQVLIPDEYALEQHLSKL